MYKVRMRINRCQKIGTLFIRFKQWFRRAVTLQCAADFLEARVATLCQPQLLQKFTNAAVTVAAAGCTIVLQAFHADGTVCTRMAYDFDAIRQHTNLDRLPHIIPLVIHSIGQGFFNSREGIVEVALSFGNISLLDNLLGDHRIADVLECIPQLLVQRSLECLFDDSVAAQIIRELHNINLRIGEILMRFKAEEHQTHVLRMRILR